MKQIIVTANQKGGVSKSTTAHQIGAYLSSKGSKTLLIDLDGQANLSLALGKKNKGLKTSYDLLDKDIKAPVEEVIAPITKNMDLIPASNDLNIVSLPNVAKHQQLKKALAPVMDKYDYIVIDTAPALDDKLINALSIATQVVVPAQADLYSLDAIKDLAETIAAVKESYNEGLKVAGILLTRNQSRYTLTKEITELISNSAKLLDAKLFNAAIRESVSVRESAPAHQSIFEYAPKSAAANDYKLFCEELIKRF